jgi:hypothetical protein
MRVRFARADGGPDLVDCRRRRETLPVARNFFFITVCALINRRGVFIREAESRKQEGSIQWLAD